MTALLRTLLVSADELRRAFDGAFAAPPEQRSDDFERLLAMRIGRDAYAVRIGELAGFAAAPKIVPVSSPIPQLLGIAGIRGNLVPVYSLAALLGYEQGEEGPRWFILCTGEDPIAMAFADLEGYLELPRSEVRAQGEGEVQRKHVREMVRTAGEMRAVIDLMSLARSIKERVALALAIKEP
jgi:chemotaxis signal transduction protein